MRSLVAAALVVVGCNADDPAVCADAAASDNPLRRLTTAQYINAIHDLFPLPGGEPLEVLPVEGVERAQSGRVWLPAEQRIGGYAGNAQGQMVSATLVERYNENAILIAAEVADRASQIFGCPASSCGVGTLRDLAIRAWRRPLTDAELDDLGLLYTDASAAHGATVALQLGIQHVLVSPDFLYLPELGEPGQTDASGQPCGGGQVPLTDFELASRLSFFLWNTTPDDALLDLAWGGGLSTPEQVRHVASEMMQSSLFEHGLLGFHDEWLELHAMGGYAREAVGGGPFVDEYHPRLMREQVQRFVSATVGGDTPTLRELLTGTRFPVHGELVSFYDVDVDGLAPPGDPDSEDFSIDDVWVTVDVDPAKRAGVFTMAGPMTVRATYAQTNPVQRGLFLLERLLCTELPAPPGDVDTSVVSEVVEDGGPETNRERFAEHTESAACAGCHESIDPFGFAFEHYNATGAWWPAEAWATGDWEEDPGAITWLDIDASGTLGSAFVPADLAGYGFSDAVELMQLLGESYSVHACYTEQLYRYALGRGVAESSPDEQHVHALAEAFYAADGDIPALILDFVTSDAFMTRPEGS